MKVHIETRDGFYSDCDLTLSESGIYVSNNTSSVCSYEIPWEQVSAADGGNLHPYKVNKIALECLPRGRTILLMKIYIPVLPDVYALLKAMEERGIKAKSGRIPSPLHHHRMLPLYTPALRYILTVIRKFYRFLTFFGLLFYITNLMALVPEIDVDQWVNFYGDVMHAATTNPLWLVVAIVLSPWALMVTAALMGLVLARNFTHLLLSLSALHDIGVVYAIAKDARHTVNNIRSLFALGHRRHKVE